MSTGHVLHKVVPYLVCQSGQQGQYPIGPAHHEVPMNSFRKILVFALAISLQTLENIQAQQGAGITTPIRFEGSQATLQMDTWGNAFSSWTMKGQTVNPYDWSLKPLDMPKNNQVGPPFRGHFLCVGRWGAPSDGEIAKGIPHNGEVNTLRWKVAGLPNKDSLVAKTELTLPREQMLVKRKVKVHATGTSYQVTESFTNLLSLGRIHNVVQHATIGGVFLNANTLIDCNAGDGFDQAADPQKLDSLSFRWPQGKLVTGPIADLRRTMDDRGYVTTHLFDADQQLGWVTATDPISGSLIGYVWKTSEYPWVNLWHWKKDGKPHAHGLEFGTCGLGQPYKLLLDKRVSFRGRNMFDYIDAGETQTKHYMAFYITIPKDFAGVKTLALSGKKLTLKEQGPKGRTVEADVIGMP